MGRNAERVRMEKEIHTPAEVLRKGNRQCPSVEAGLGLLDCKDLGLQSENDWELFRIVLEVFPLLSKLKRRKCRLSVEFGYFTH